MCWHLLPIPLLALLISTLFRSVRLLSCKYKTSCSTCSFAKSTELWSYLLLCKSEEGKSINQRLATISQLASSTERNCLVIDIHPRLQNNSHAHSAVILSHVLVRTLFFTLRYGHLSAAGAALTELTQEALNATGSFSQQPTWPRWPWSQPASSTPCCFSARAWTCRRTCP